MLYWLESIQNETELCEGFQNREMKNLGKEHERERVYVIQRKYVGNNTLIQREQVIESDSRISKCRGISI